MDSKDPRNGVPMGTFKQGGDNDPASASKAERSVADPAAADTTPDLLGGRPSRKRVRTLLGVPLAEALGEQAPRPERPGHDDDISKAIQSVLDDEDIAIPVEIEDIDGEISLLADAELAEYFDSAPPGTLKPIIGNSDPLDAKSAPALPLLIPSQYQAAQVRERDTVSDTAKQSILSFASDRDSESSIDTRKQPALIRDERDSDSAADTHKRPALMTAPVVVPPPAAGVVPLSAATSSSTSASSRDASSTPLAAAAISSTLSSLPPLAQISSLAPRELRRPPPASADSTPRLGLMMVAAMALIAGGGWWLTSGSFSRSGEPSGPHLESSAPQAVAQPPAAPTQAEPAMMQAPATLAPATVPPAVEEPDSPDSKDSVSVAGPAPKLATRDKALVSTARAPGKPKKAKAQSGGASDMPEAPSRAIVVQRLESVRSSVQACAAGRSGVADLDITIAHSGVVTHVLVGGDFAGTMQGSCIARAVREARFPPFQQERLRLLFPYAI